MAIQWAIVNMQRVIDNGFVIIADWTCTAMQDGQSAYVYGQQSFPYDPSEPDFIPYDQLTEVEVIGWVQTAMGAEQVAAYEANAQGALDKLLHPTTADGLPWVQPTPPMPVVPPVGA